MTPETILAPADFVALINQTLEFAYPSVTIEGELANFRISKNRWVYFDLIDEAASVKFFGTVYNLPGPLEDGLKLRVAGAPRLHPRFGFSVNILSMSPAGEGSIKKAAQLLQAKLEAEGLFDPDRKRPLPALPRVIGLITAADSAARHDFIKILNERWGGVTVRLADVYVQGERAPLAIVQAIEYFNKLPTLPDMLVITRGGGSADDLQAFSDERVVRAVAASRVPTLVAIGHEVDVSLAELAADAKASTPTNAAQVAVPDKKQVRAELGFLRHNLTKEVIDGFQGVADHIDEDRKYLTSQVFLYLKNLENTLVSARKLVAVFDPQAALKRGYAIVSRAGRHLSRAAQARAGDVLTVRLVDGKMDTKVIKLRLGD